MPRRELLLYDLDGTLIDTAEDLTRAANQMLKTLDYPPISRAQVLRYVGEGLQQLVARCVGSDDPELISRGIALFWASYSHHLVDRSRPYPAAPRVLDYFHGRIQAVVTNKPHSLARRLLDTLGLGGYFIDIIGAEGAYPNKPNPAAVRALLRRTGLVRAQALLVGDSRIDVETGRRAGVFTVIVRSGFSTPQQLCDAKPDAVVDNLGELLRIARSNGW